MKKIGYDWGSFTGISLNKDEDSSRIIEALKIPEVTECYYITGSYLVYQDHCPKSRTHAKITLWKIDVIPGIAKTLMKNWAVHLNVT
jgi:Lrp/AsnC family transcriptional regulator for asnA, asnC and gidA